MVSRDIVQELTKIGFKPDPKSRYDHQIFNYGKWCVQFSLESNGMWIWVDRGGKIIRQFVRTNKASRDIIRRLNNQFIKKNA